MIAASLYHEADSPVHALAPGLKLLLLALAGTLIFVIASPLLLLAALMLCAGLYALARIPFSLFLGQIKPVLWFLGMIFLAQWWFQDWLVAVISILRFAILVWAASLVTLTTRTSAMLEAMERGFQPLQRFGLDAAKISLALSMVLRFIPVLVAVAKEVREAQAARGLDRNLLALAVPLIIRTLKMADDVAQAIEARS
ncbi:energy-coupling factor transporter transmembrane component T family protein [Limoniibacter endophyticus]|uniref:Cobalt ABC transporter permease n=1 Tax=Limoniibacter endophyticus TaxID=1565040 RepID=A0A8J3DMD4_9HYPH|nr:energy-coupling factor transporter transmembrane protein EcfT [Limoniibacter endophyticus]GHC67204.1 cobalt ABC transporter permease [Limoniibacter endophyticus]